MSVATRFSYDYVFDLASQLSPAEQTRLVQELPKPKSVSEVSAKPKIKYECEFESFLPDPDRPPFTTEEYLEVLRNGPVIDEEHIELMLAAREEVNKCQPIFL
jgi:hypothetical protein